METDTLSFPVLHAPAQAHGELLLAEPAEAPVGPVELLCFHVDGQEYGLPLNLIQEIRRYQTATRLPGQTAAALGVMDLRGQVIALLDLRRLLGLPDAEPDGEDLRAVVVLVHEDRYLGLVADDVVDVLLARTEELRALPGLPGDGSHRHFGGLISSGTRRVLLLRPGEWIAAHASVSA